MAERRFHQGRGRRAERQGRRAPGRAHHAFQPGPLDRQSRQGTDRRPTGSGHAQTRPGAQLSAGRPNSLIGGRNSVMRRNLLCALAALLALIWSAAPSRLAQSRILTEAKPRGRALLVGVNQYQVKGIRPTPGAIEDAEATGKLIQEKGWFDAGEIKTLVGEQATAANIEREFNEWLIRGTSPGDLVFFLYSGHGTQAPDDDGDERRSDPTDDKDEAIAPYDVNVVNGRPVNIIRDDQFNDWLGRLGGRSIVMVFDSCNSGTVSRGPSTGGSETERLGPRYLPTPEQWQWGAQTRSMTDGNGYVVSDGPQSRDLKLSLDKDRLAPNSMLAVFSAARSYQTAWPMRTPQGGYRGAFSYFIEQALREIGRA